MLRASFDHESSMLRLVLLLAFLMPVPAMAGLVSCHTSVRGTGYDFRYDPDNAALKESRTLRAKVFGEPGDVTCPALVTLRALTPELNDAERAPFCLQWDPRKKTYLGYDAGERDAYGNCREPSKSFCERIVGTAKAVSDFGSDVQDQAKDAAGSVIGDKFGAKVVNSQSGRLRDKLLKAGMGVLAAASPEAIVASAVIVGGTAYVCSEKGAKGAGAEAAPAPELKDGAEIDEGADLLGAKLPGQAPSPEVSGISTAPVEVSPLPAPEPKAPDTE
ncbi:hypothetical protein DW2_04400 [Thioclava atlantica]|uniref:Lipoprotein n=2 Tax=Thioclava atlantica TaxID=1317124 RepID=A0A085TYP2_9RHOB|nr:hypothetical protein DW2_04400 [Thioclava atlantica]